MNRTGCVLESKLDQLVRSQPALPRELVGVVGVIRDLMWDVHRFGVDLRGNDYRIETTVALCTQFFLRIAEPLHDSLCQPEANCLICQAIRIANIPH